MKAKSPKPRKARERRAAYRPVRPALTRDEQSALDDFRARLRTILPEDALHSLILYGSKARGETHRGSDVDVLVVHRDISPQQRDQIDDLLWEFHTTPEIEPYLEVMVKPVREIQEQASIGIPFLQNVARDGIVLEGEPIMVQPMDKRTIANERLEKARRGLAAAKWMTDNSDYAGAVAKAYFIFLDLADAGLVTKGITPQSHAGTVKMFGMHFVKTGLVPPEYGRWFGKMEEERIDADYKMKTVWTKEDAQRRVERAEKLLAMMESIVVKNLEEERE